MDKKNFTTKLHQCCSDSKKELRPYALAVHFKNGYAYATDGTILIKSALEYHSIIKPEFLEGKALHRDNFKEIMKFDIAECCEDGISCRSEDGQVAFYEYFDMQGTVAPDFDKIIPTDMTGAKSIFQIGIDPDRMGKLTSSMFSDTGTFRLTFSGQLKAIVVDVIGYDKQVGILMPRALSESIFPD